MWPSVKTVNRKIQKVPQSQTAANPRHQEEEKNDKKLTRTKQTNKCTRSKCNNKTYTTVTTIHTNIKIYYVQDKLADTAGIYKGYHIRWVSQRRTLIRVVTYSN